MTLNMRYIYILERDEITKIKTLILIT